MTARVAILTDVHGNAAALRAALADIDRTADVERIYSLGDMIAIGPDTNEVLDMLFFRDDVSMILGNHEDAVLAAVAGDDPGSPGTERIHHFWVASQIVPQFVSALRSLPRRLQPEYEGQQLLLIHYHLTPDGRFAPVDREPTLEKLEHLYAGSTAAAVCFGHHHPVHLYRSTQRLYVNPGSLGCCHEPLARYAILICESTGVHAELRAVPYDNRDFLASYRRLDVPAGDFILALFHGNQHLSR
jgi:putative phosphoesterase